MIFADIPDNIGLKYAEYDDNLDEEEYRLRISEWLMLFATRSPVIWLSFNTRWLPAVGYTVYTLLGCRLEEWNCKPCTQVFTFGQHNHKWLGDNMRPLWCLYHCDAEFYPDDIRVESERQRMGDKRADPRGRVPGNVFDFPRVPGNSKQRRRWHPTQLHEGLVERCIRFSTRDGQHVCDPFAGTGTTLRVCRRIGRRCTLVEIDSTYCEELLNEHQDLEFDDRLPTRTDS